jgi:hypothetical protein
VIILLFIVLGLVVRLAAGHGLGSLRDAKLRGESLLLLLLVAQVALPLLKLAGPAARVAFWAWLGTFVALAAVALLNRAQPGMGVLAIGLLSNFIVVAANGGMPVLPAAAAAARGRAALLAVPVGDFVHVLARSGTRFVWLADVIPLPGPSWLRALVSVGDCLLLVGVATFLGAVAGARTEHPLSARVVSRNTEPDVE